MNNCSLRISKYSINKMVSDDDGRGSPHGARGMSWHRVRAPSRCALSTPPEVGSNPMGMHARMSHSATARMWRCAGVSPTRGARTHPRVVRPIHLFIPTTHHAPLSPANTETLTRYRSIVGPASQTINRYRVDVSCISVLMPLTAGIQLL